MKTVLGQVITRDGAACQSYLHQPEPERVGPLAYRARPAQLRRRHFAIAALEVRTVQRSWLGVNIDHDHGRTIGRVAHLELAADGSLWAVGQLHGPTPEGAVYFSPEWTWRRDGSDLLLDAIALTPEPAQILMEPVAFYEGDLRDHGHWPLPQRHAALVGRAAQASRSRGWSDPLMVHDADADRAETRELAELRELELRGGMVRQSAHPGRILSVR